MGYAELIERLQTLPDAKQAEVFDFVEFLTHRNQVKREAVHSLAESPLAGLMRQPLTVEGFAPLNREEANAR